MNKKKMTSVILTVLLVAVFCLFALGSVEESTTSDQGNATVSQEDNTNLGDYSIEIKNCRLAKDYEGKEVAIITYGFTNNGEDAASFTFSFEDNVYQNGVGLNKAYVLAESANYDEGNQTKEIKKGASLDVDVAYELNDSKTALEVEVKEIFSFSDSVVKKTFDLE